MKFAPKVLRFEEKKERRRLGPILGPMFGKMLDRAARSGFEAMNEKLKELAEAGRALSG